MDIQLQLLISIYKMYKDGELAAEFDKKTNKMVNSSALQNIMSQIKNIIPEELSGKEAASAMRELEPEARDSAIEAAGDKIIDMREEFRRRMSENGGALGLTKALVKAIEEGNTDAAMIITANMVELVNHSE